MLLPIHPTHPEPRKITRVVETLERGGVIVYPTDTVYGLGCDIRQKKALTHLYRMKGIADDHPVSFVCPDLADIARYAVVDDFAYRIMKRLLPGPFTFILNSTREVPRMLMRKRKTVGIRVPDHPVTLALVKELGAPILSTSASRPDEPFINDPEEIAGLFKSADIVIDSGLGGLEPSTILDLSEGRVELVREGAGDPGPIV